VNDWSNRKYHKKCYKQIITRDDESDSYNNDSNDSDNDSKDMNIKENIPKWVDNIPRLKNKVGYENKWHQEKSCLHCGRDKYNPVFYYGFRQICKLCLGNNTHDIQKKYGYNYDDIDFLDSDSDD
jgi:hypothetical protein